MQKIANIKSTARANKIQSLNALCKKKIATIFLSRGSNPFPFYMIRIYFLEGKEFKEDTDSIHSLTVLLSLLFSKSSNFSLSTNNSH